MLQKMASFQTRKIVDSFLDEDNFIDYKIIHRFGKLLPTDNIVLILVASKHRKIGFDFIETLLILVQIKNNFWKKKFTLEVMHGYKNKSRFIN